MKTKQFSKTNIAREYRDKYGMEMPTLKLARIMHSENRLLFRDVEDARSALRQIEGKNGSEHRDGTTHGELKKYFIDGDRPRNPYNLPESDESSYEPYVIKGHKRVAIFADKHTPYHSVEAISAALNFCKKEKVDALIDNGDGLDFYSLSRFCRDPRKRSFAQELLMWKQIKEKEQKILGCKQYVKIGNHEERYQHFLFQKAGELVGVEEFELENILQARAEGIEVIKDKRIVKLNDLNVIHGHEFGTGFFSPVNIARGLFLRAKVSAIQGHNHQTSEHTETNMNGEITTTWSIGCLCGLHPEFLPINKWNHGFAIVDLDDKNGFEVRNYRIYKGKVL